MFPFTVKTQLGEKESIAFNKEVVKKGRRALIIADAVFLAVYFSLAIYTYFITGELPNAAMIIVGAALLLLLALFLIQPLTVRSSVRRSLAKQGVSEITFEFFEDHMVDDYANKLSSGRTEYLYESFVKVLETGDHFFLFLNAMQAYIVPKADMTPEQEELLRGALTRALPQKKYKQES